MTEQLGANDDVGFDVNTILVQKDDNEVCFGEIIQTKF